jgi:hypothetical protein
MWCRSLCNVALKEEKTSLKTVALEHIEIRRRHGDQFD